MLAIRVFTPLASMQGTLMLAVTTVLVVSRTRACLVAPPPPVVSHDLVEPTTLILTGRVDRSVTLSKTDRMGYRFTETPGSGTPSLGG